MKTAGFDTSWYQQIVLGLVPLGTHKGRNTVYENYGEQMFGSFHNGIPFTKKQKESYIGVAMCTLQASKSGSSTLQHRPHPPPSSKLPLTAISWNNTDLSGDCTALSHLHMAQLCNHCGKVNCVITIVWAYTLEHCVCTIIWWYSWKIFSCLH